MSLERLMPLDIRGETLLKPHEHHGNMVPRGLRGPFRSRKSIFGTIKDFYFLGLILPLGRGAYDTKLFLPWEQWNSSQMGSKSEIYFYIIQRLFSFVIITFDWNGNFLFWCLHRKDLFQIYQNMPTIFQNQNFFFNKNQFWFEKLFSRFFLVHFFTLFPKFSDLINSNDCIGKITSKSIGKNKLFLVKKW